MGWTKPVNQESFSEIISNSSSIENAPVMENSTQGLENSHGLENCPESVKEVFFEQLSDAVPSDRNLWGSHTSESELATEEDCAAYLYALKWPNGFVCPECRHSRAYTI